MSANTSSRLMISASRRGHRRLHMNDVVVVKTAHNVHDRVDLADVGQELVASPSPRDAPLTRPAMSTNSMVAGVTFFGWYICQRLQAAVRHVHDSHIGFNGAKGVICGLRARICNGVKQRALPTFGRPTIPIFILLPHQPSNRRTASFVGLVVRYTHGLCPAFENTAARGPGPQKCRTRPSRCPTCRRRRRRRRTGRHTPI